MKEIIYKGVGSVFLTNEEFKVAKQRWASESVYFCPRTNDMYGFMISFTRDRELEHDFIPLYSKSIKGVEGEVTRYLLSKNTNNYFIIPEGLSFHEAYENIITQDYGKYGLIPTKMDDEDRKIMMTKFITEDQYLDNGNSLVPQTSLSVIDSTSEIGTLGAQF